MAQSNKKPKKQKIKAQSKSTKKAVSKAPKKAKGKETISPPKHNKKQVAKSHKSKMSQAHSAKKKAKSTLKEKPKISKPAKPLSKKSTVKAKKVKVAKKTTKTPSLKKVSKSDKRPLKTAVATTQQKDQLKKPTPSKIQNKLKETKKELSKSKSKPIHTTAQKPTQKKLSPSSKKIKKDTAPIKKPLIASQSKAESISQKKDKEIFYDAIEATFHNEQVVLTNAEGKQFCHHKECDQVATTDIYCRHHYISLWDLIQRKKKILEGGMLEKFMQEITTRYPDKFLDMIRKTLSTERDFTTTLQELEIAHAGDLTADYQDSHKDISQEEDHIPFSEDRSET